MNLRTTLFGNDLEWRTNLSLLGYLYYCRLKSRNTLKRQNVRTAILAHVQNLRTRGFTILDSGLNVDNLEKAVSKYYQEIFELKNGYAEMKQEEAKKLAPLFENVFEAIAPIITRHYQSYYKPLWGVIQRIVPGDADNNSSLGFHSDNNPVTSLKFMVYLQDTTRDGGAFSIFDRGTMKKLCKEENYISQSNSMRANAHAALRTRFGAELDKWIHSCVGKKGSIVIFDNNLIHKGTLPKSGKRDTVVFQLFPSEKPCSMSDIEHAFTRKQISSPIVISGRKILAKFSNPFLRPVQGANK